jgi:flavin reductase (DIM6/NTAB) family NADH-FMN oxidoreductase RutF
MKRGKSAFDPAELDPLSIYKMMAGSIVPRPIGFISTVSENGIFNAAPFSFFNMVSHIPPLVSVSIAHQKRSGEPKDTLTNILATGEFVVNIVSSEIVAAVERCSENYPSDVDEIAAVGLTAIPGLLVKPPLIAESPVNFECVLVGQSPLPDSIHSLLIGRIVQIHVRDGVISSDYRVNQTELAAIGRMAGRAYCHTDSVFTLAHDGFAAVPTNQAK